MAEIAETAERLRAERVIMEGVNVGGGNNVSKLPSKKPFGASGRC